MKSLIFGIATNDSLSETKNCIYYQTWKNMLKRCYYLAERKQQPTYDKCTVCPEWLLFSNFRSWMKTQNWKGKELDKDIIKANNKYYSPEYCCFVSQYINNMLKTRKASRGFLPLGVTLNSTGLRYRATMRVRGKLQSHGTYDTIEEASQAYCQVKAREIKKEADQINDERIKQGLHRHAALYLSGAVL